MDLMSFDATRWIRFDSGAGRIDVTEPLTWGGVYRSVTMAELDQLAATIGGAPLTKSISDAVWYSASKKIVPPTMSAVGEVDHDGASEAFTSALLASDDLSPPGYVDVGAKDWILDELTADAATNYGLRDSMGGVAQPIRTAGDPRRHNCGHRDWSQLARLWRAPGGASAMSSLTSSLGASRFGAQAVSARWHGPAALPDAPDGGRLDIGGSKKKFVLALGAVLLVAWAAGWLE